MQQIKYLRLSDFNATPTSRSLNYNSLCGKKPFIFFSLSYAFHFIISSHILEVLTVSLTVEHVRNKSRSSTNM